MCVAFISLHNLAIEPLYHSLSNFPSSKKASPSGTSYVLTSERLSLLAYAVCVSLNAENLLTYVICGIAPVDVAPEVYFGMVLYTL